MAKKRDRKEHRADSAFQSGVLDPRAFEGQGTSFADLQGHLASEGDIGAWDDEETAPDIFAERSAEDRMDAGGHTQRQDEEPKGTEPPGLRRR
jgi:hypothetical protein